MTLPLELILLRFFLLGLHVNLLHALCNAWCLLSLVFYYDLPMKKIVLAYLIAVTIPAFALSPTPAVGLSGLCFALMGLTVYVVRRKAMFVGWIMAFLAVGFLFRNVAVWLHVYCFAAGLLLGIFTTPMLWQRRK